MNALWIIGATIAASVCRELIRNGDEYTQADKRLPPWVAKLLGR